MRNWNTLSGALAVALMLASVSAWGHAVLSSPVPRDLTCDDVSCKAAPCGGQNPGAPKYKIEKDGELAITWNETVDHQGCFVLELSTTGDDKAFNVLQTIPDEANAVPLMRTRAVRLDGGIECEHCVLRLRQIMSGSSSDCTADTDASTYFSCADIVIGTDASVPDAAPSSDNDAGRASGGYVDAGGSASNGGGPYEVDPITPAAGRGCVASPQPPDALSYGALFGVAMIFGGSALRGWRRGRSGRRS